MSPLSPVLKRRLWWLAGALALALLQVSSWLLTGTPLSNAGLGWAGWAAYGLLAAFLLCLGLLKRGLAFDWQPLAVARTLLDEALRMKMAVVFIVLMFLLIAGLPFSRNPNTLLKYHIQSFLGYSIGATAFLLSLLTIFLCCGSLAGEVEDKRIFTTLTKPIGRGDYLLGKWLGAITLNLVLLTVAGAGIYGLTLFMAAQPAAEREDASEVFNDVLTGRIAMFPTRPADIDARAVEVLKLQAQVDDSNIKQKGYETALAEVILQEEQRTWRTIPPGGEASFVFDDMDAARRSGRQVQLRFKVQTAGLAKTQTPILIIINDFYRLWGQAQLRGFTNVSFDSKWLGEKGAVKVTFKSLEQETPRPMSFPPGENLEILYHAGGFAGNLTRALLLEWCKLAFLAALSLFAATFLSFPVASLLTLVMYALAEASVFLHEALRFFKFDNESADAAFAKVRAQIQAVIDLFGTYGQLAAVEPVTNGRFVEWEMVVRGVGVVGLIWTVLTLFLAWVIFRRRELGRVQV